jgi:hypothetical protein
MELELNSKIIAAGVMQLLGIGLLAVAILL